MFREIFKGLEGEEGKRNLLIDTLVLSNKIVAGILTETDDMQYIFKYEDDYLINHSFRAISLAFPKRKEEYISDKLL